MTDVKCKVKSCYFWQNDVCNADSITVDNNLGARTNMEVGSPDAKTGATGVSKTASRGRTTDFEAGDIATGKPNDILSGQGTRTGTDNKVLAKTSHETLCTTFRPKGTEARH